MEGGEGENSHGTELGDSVTPKFCEAHTGQSGRKACRFL